MVRCRPRLANLSSSFLLKIDGSLLEQTRTDSASVEKAESDATAKVVVSPTRVPFVTFGRQGHVGGILLPSQCDSPFPEPLVFLGRRVWVMVVQCGLHQRCFQRDAPM